MVRCGIAPRPVRCGRGGWGEGGGGEVGFVGWGDDRWAGRGVGWGGDVGRVRARVGWCVVASRQDRFGVVGVGGERGGEGKWDSLGGGMIGGPGAVSGGAGTLDVFVHGLDGALWHRAKTGSVWSGWVGRGGGRGSGIRWVGG